jgi:hypothetical protein
VDLVQVQNPKTGLYVKIDRDKGVIVGHKKTNGPYGNIPIMTKEREEFLRANEKSLDRLAADTLNNGFDTRRPCFEGTE